MTTEAPAPAERVRPDLLADALRPNGRITIVDILPSERSDGPRPAVLYALGLVRRTGSGRIYPYSTFTLITARRR